MTQKLKHKDLDISLDDSFKNCKLERKQYADTLTNIINIYADGFVLAINNEWGTGKTTFVKMWQRHLEKEGYKTSYLNAWENDLYADPLVAILGKLKMILGEKKSSTFEKVLKNGAIIGKNLIPAIGKALVDKYIDTDIVSDAIKSTIDATNEILNSEVEEYIKKEKGIEEFKSSLQKFVQEECNDKPLVFIVDELDRCRPNYAVEILEKIKHFFSVEGIIFVLSIDKKQLESSIKGFYGSESINADEYLRRFIDVEYRLPEPNMKSFCKHLYDYYEFAYFFENSDRIRFLQYNNEKDYFIEFSSKLFSINQSTLRHIEKLWGYARIILHSCPPQYNLSPGILILLIYVRTFRQDVYYSIRDGKYSIQELVSIFEEMIDFPISKYAIEYSYFMQLLVAYEYKIQKEEIGKKTDLLLTNDKKIQFTTIATNITSEETLCKYIIGSRSRIIDLDSIIKKIDLYNFMVIPAI